MAAIQRENAVQFVAGLVDAIAAARLRASRARETIACAQGRLDLAEREEADNARKLLEELQRMDLTSSGNYGWERRLTAFLVELRGQPAP